MAQFHLEDQEARIFRKINSKINSSTKTCSGASITATMTSKAFVRTVYAAFASDAPLESTEIIILSILTNWRKKTLRIKSESSRTRSRHYRRRPRRFLTGPKILRHTLSNYRISSCGLRRFKIDLESK